MGAGDSSRTVLTRKRPSGDTSYWRPISGFVPPPHIRDSNRATGVPASKLVPLIVTDAAMNLPSGATYYNSFPSDRHRGTIPPPVEICHWPLTREGSPPSAGATKGRTYVS